MFGKRSKSAIAVAAPRAAPVSITGTMLTHTGCVREHNEDIVAYVLPRGGAPRVSDDMLAVVADGMGGHAAGEVASRIAADTVLRVFYEKQAAPPQLLTACLQTANREIYERSLRDVECAGMGTTCTVLAIRDGVAFLGHIGDSRAYLWRDREFRQLSEDHSLVAQLVREGLLTEREAACSPDRNVIVRALGIEPSCEPLIWREGLPVRPGDVFVLCSDGLSDLVEPAVVGRIAAQLPPFEACQALIDMALAAGGTDNVSVGVFAVGDGTRSRTPPTTRPLPDPGPAS